MLLMSQFTKQDLFLLDDCKNFSEMSEIVLSVLKRTQPSVELCGPISRGAFKLKKNLRVFKSCMKYLQTEGFNPFNVIPLQPTFVRLATEWKKAGNEEYCMPILDEVYKTIFESGFIQKAFFIPRWEESLGARWERETSLRLGIEILEFPEDQYLKILKDLKINSKPVLL